MSTGADAARRPPACLLNPSHEDLTTHLIDGRFVWVDLEGPTDAELRRLANLLELHPLTYEDARTFSEPPKVEEYDGYLYLVVYGVDPGTASEGPLLREVHMIVSGSTGATDMYLSTVANRHAEVNKQLTIIATIFVPLMFLTSFFGQNFSYLTDGVLKRSWAFWVLGLGLELVSVIGLVLYLWRRRSM